MELPSAVTEARSEAGRLGSIASDYASSEYTIPDQLRKTVQEALDYNKDVIGMRSTALADYFAAPSQANAKFGVQQFGTGPQAGQQNPDFIFNPFERNAAIQGFVNNQSIPFNTANALLGMREGTIADTIDAGTRAFQSQSSAAQQRAQAARQNYADVLGEFKTVEDMKLEKRRLDIEELKAKQANSGSDLSSIFSYLQELMGGNTEGAATEKGDAYVEEDDPLANDPLFGPVAAAQKQKEQAQAGQNIQLPAGIKLLPSSSQKSGTLSLSGNSPYNFKSLGLQGLNMTGTTQ